MAVPAVSQFHTHWTNISSTLDDDEPALLTIRTLVEPSTYFEQDWGPLEFMKWEAVTVGVIILQSFPDLITYQEYSHILQENYETPV
jgi:hypothetical protein